MLTDIVEGYKKGKIATPNLIWLEKYGSNIQMMTYIGKLVSSMERNQVLENDTGRLVPKEECRSYSQIFLFLAGIASSVVSLYVKDRIARAVLPYKKYKKTSFFREPQLFRPELN
jgi:hypothetical protein